MILLQLIVGMVLALGVLAAVAVVAQTEANKRNGGRE